MTQPKKPRGRPMVTRYFKSGPEPPEPWAVDTSKDVSWQLIRELSDLVPEKNRPAARRKMQEVLEKVFTAMEPAVQLTLARLEASARQSKGASIANQKPKGGRKKFAATRILELVKFEADHHEIAKAAMCTERRVRQVLQPAREKIVRLQHLPRNQIAEQVGVCPAYVEQTLRVKQKSEGNN